jgi:hypothetical protein
MNILELVRRLDTIMQEHYMPLPKERIEEEVRDRVHELVQNPDLLIQCLRNMEKVRPIMVNRVI